MYAPSVKRIYLSPPSLIEQPSVSNPPIFEELQENKSPPTPTSDHEPIFQTSQFTPSDWVRAQVTLLENGDLKIINSITGSFIMKKNLQSRFHSGIRQLEYSVFHLPNVVYIGEFPQVGPASSLDPSHYERDNTPSISTSTNPKTRLRKLRSGLDLSSQPWLIRHTNETPCKSDQAIYLKFDSQEECRQWFISLRSTPRLQVFAPSTGNPEKSFRFARTLTLRILEAKVDTSELSCSKSGRKTLVYPELYVEISLGNRIWGRTSVSGPSKSPFWREDFIFKDIDTPTVPKVLLQIRRRLSDDPSHDPLIGTITLTHEDLLSNGNLETWYRLETLHKSEKDEGALCVKVNLEEMTIAGAKHYEEVHDALSSLSDRRLALLTMAEDYLPRSDITPMSDLCLNIALASPTSTPGIKWISALISQDITKSRLYIVKKQGRDCFKDYCTIEQHEFKKNMLNTLFRGNTILTKSLEKFMRTVGQAHLEKIIGNFVQDVVGACPDLEIDPTRINLASSSQDNLSAEDAQSIKANQVRLLEYTTRLWSLIRTSVDELPTSFKIIFRHLSDELIDKLQLSEQSVNNSVAGFLFLRYYCPGLLNPKLFGFINAQQASAVHRPLTLITKMIMAFANRNRFGMKEPFMIPMNVFFDEHEDELNKYFKVVVLKGKTHEEVRALKAVDIPGVLPKRSNSSNSKGVPLAEQIDNSFLLDEHVNFARFFEFWRNVLEPNKAEMFEKIKEFTAQREALNSGVSIPSSNIEDTDFNEQIDDSPEKSNESALRAQLESQAIERGLNWLYEACRGCYNTVKQIVDDLSDKPEVFDVKSIPAYSRHMPLVRSVGAGSIRLNPGISAHSDWLNFNEMEAQVKAPVAETSDSELKKSISFSHLKAKCLPPRTSTPFVDSSQEAYRTRRRSSPVTYSHSHVESSSNPTSMRAHHIHASSAPGFTPTAIPECTSPYLDTDISTPYSSSSEEEPTGATENVTNTEDVGTQIDHSFDTNNPTTSTSSSSSTAALHNQNQQSQLSSSSTLSSGKRIPRWFKNWP